MNNEKRIMMNKTFSVVESTCIPIAIDNCNTDLIIPARYLASTTRDPQFFGEAFMHDLRYDARGRLVEDFVMNQAPFSEAPHEGVRQIIVYKGSFDRVYPHAGPQEARSILRGILRHEFRHHLEFLGGNHSSASLEAEDERKKQAYLARHADDPPSKAGPARPKA